MKAITLYQPHATLIAIGAKTIETRSWRPPPSLVGQRIAIHAAKRKSSAWNWSIDFINEVGRLLPDGERHPWPLGSVVATGLLQCAHQVRDWTYFEGPYPNKQIQANFVPLATGMDPLPSCPHSRDRWHCFTDIYGSFARGRWLWFLGEVEPLPTPVPAVGRQRVWEWTEGGA